MAEWRTGPKVVVVGSINMDLVARVGRLPRAGETVQGEQLLQIPGGKGANQAVAVAQLGGIATLVGRVGDDGFGPVLKQALAARGVDTRHVEVTADCSSGVALIGVEQSGENAITVVAGANGRLSVQDVQRRSSTIAAADALLVQLEVPIETVAAAVRIAVEHGVLTVLDPAPVPDESLPEVLHQVDVITPNQTEAEALTSISANSIPAAKDAARALHGRGIGCVVVKLGAQGALLSSEDGQLLHQPAAQVAVADSTAAGDAFTAALALALAQGLSHRETLQLACAAGTLATTRMGAQQAMPTREEVEVFLKQGRPGD